MTPGGLLLRVVLMLSLLLNGLNAAMAGPMTLAMAHASTAEAAPPCHGDAPAAPPHHDPAATAGAQGPQDGDHCKIKECLRSCAQLPSLTVAIAWLPSPPPPALAPLGYLGTAMPMPPQDRITRPPIG